MRQGGVDSPDRSHMPDHEETFADFLEMKDPVAPSLRPPAEIFKS
jgi:hypothetical protein